MVTSTCKGYSFVLKTDVDLICITVMKWHTFISSRSSDKLNVVFIVYDTSNGIKIQWTFFFTVLLNHILKSKYVKKNWGLLVFFLILWVACINFQLCWSIIDFQHYVSSFSFCFSELNIMICRSVTNCLSMKIPGQIVCKFLLIDIEYYKKDNWHILN